MTFVDPATPLVQHDVEQDILRLVRLLDDNTASFHKVRSEAGGCRVVLRVATAKSLLERSQEWARKGERPPAADLRDAQAVLDCEREVWEAEVADQVLDASKHAATNARDQLRALLSLNANVRELTR